jgi:two-component system response regulator AtoC
VAIALIVDDDADAAEMLATLVAERHYDVAVAHSLEEARRNIAMRVPDLVLLDLRLPDGDGMELFSEEGLLSNSEVVLMTGHASLESSIMALRLGAADYLVKPVSPERLRGVLSRVMRPAVLAAQIADWRGELGRTGRFGHLVGTAPGMQQVYEQIARVAATSVTVLITGESGTGKELVARTVHDLSRRRVNPFLAVNCGAISPHLMESEIFGHEKGSFTGAERQHHGFFERADGGTLFLDEVTEMPLELQVKLLRVLETGSFMRVGSTVLRQIDVRIIAATNRDLDEAVRSGSLREDLLYRLNVFPIALPPLRERLEDVGHIARHLLAQTGEREGRARHFTADALQKLQVYSWPGNVRELRNVVQRVYVMADGDSITAQWLPRDAPPRAAPTAGFPAPAAREGPGLPVPDGAGVQIRLGSSLAAAEQELILRTLSHFDNHKERTAAALGVSVKTLYNKLKSYGYS